MQVAATLTPSTAPHIAGAIIVAYRSLMGRELSAKSSWLWPLALSENETDQWRSMYNWNVGAVTTSRGDVPWFYNPLVSAPLKFRSFDEAVSGARAMLKALDQHGGIAAADAGNSNAWQTALDAYLGSGSPYPSLSGRIARLQSVQPEIIVAPPSRWVPPSTGLVVAAMLGLAATAGYAAYRSLPSWRRA